MTPRSGLFRKYVVVLLALVASTVLTSGVVEIFFSYEEDKAALLRVQREKASAAAVRIGQFTRDVEREVVALARSPWSARARTADERRVEYRRTLARSQAITEIGRLDRSGQEEMRISRLVMDVIGSGADAQGEPKFLETRSGATYFSPVYFRLESEPYMTIAALAIDRGVVFAEVNLKFMWEVVSDITVGKTGYAYVVDPRGRLIAHPDISLVLQQTDFGSLAHVRAAAIAAAEPGAPARAPMTISTDHRGRQVFTAHAEIDPLGWLVFVEQPLGETFAPLYASIARSAAVLLLGLGLAVLASVLLARRMVAPIRQLQEGAALMGKGDLAHRVDIRTGDELQALAEELNRTTAQLQEFTSELEGKVEARTQEIAAKSRELEIANQHKSQFLATVSHEIRTPLNAIIGMADVLSETPLTAEQQEYVRIFRSAGDTLLRIIDDILDLSRVEAGRLTLEAVAFDPGEVAERTAQFFSLRARAKGLTLTWQVAKDVPARVVGDPTRLRQVLVNLLGNSIKFTERGAVHLDVGRDADDPDILRFSVRDTGIGIARDKLDAIFESFTQAEASIVRRFGGTGLGLTISRRLVELMGGRLAVESEPGRGSTFTFTIRCGAVPEGVDEAGAREEEEPSERSQRGAETRPCRILLVEDTQDNQVLVRAYLKSTTWRLETADNGAIAVDRFTTSGPYDLVLMDMEMPVMDGYTATRRIRAWERERSLTPTPIVALTAYALAEETQKILEAGCDGHLSKPIRKTALVEAIAAIISS